MREEISKTLKKNLEYTREGPRQGLLIWRYFPFLWRYYGDMAILAEKSGVIWRYGDIDTPPGGAP